MSRGLGIRERKILALLDEYGAFPSDRLRRELRGRTRSERSSFNRALNGLLDKGLVRLLLSFDPDGGGFGRPPAAWFAYKCCPSNTPSSGNTYAEGSRP